jgi:HlyD family secretion protein
LRVESTARITHENIDKDGFLKILSPYSGIITEISFNQPGAKVQSRTPLASIVPENSKTILEIEIPESKRALLKEGLVVKLKVNAFKYQRYGFLTGKLEYISPTTRISQHTKRPYYKGRVSLDKIAFLKDGTEYPLHFGMTAIAEIVVRQRRIIDIVLDPIQG